MTGALPERLNQKEIDMLGKKWFVAYGNPLQVDEVSNRLQLKVTKQVLEETGHLHTVTPAKRKDVEATRKKLQETQRRMNGKHN